MIFCGRLTQLAAQNGNLAAVLFLANNGHDLNAVDAGGNTALHLAAMNGFVPVCAALMKLVCKA